MVVAIEGVAVCRAPVLGGVMVGSIAICLDVRECVEDGEACGFCFGSVWILFRERV